MLTDAFHVTERERHLWVICGLIGRLGIFVMFVGIHTCTESRYRYMYQRRLCECFDSAHVNSSIRQRMSALQLRRLRIKKRASTVIFDVHVGGQSRYGRASDPYIQSRARFSYLSSDAK